MTKVPTSVSMAINIVSCTRHAAISLQLWLCSLSVLYIPDLTLLRAGLQTLLLFRFLTRGNNKKCRVSLCSFVNSYS